MNMCNILHAEDRADVLLAQRDYTSLSPLSLGPIIFLPSSQNLCSLPCLFSFSVSSSASNKCSLPMCFSPKAAKSTLGFESQLCCSLLDDPEQLLT